VSKTALGPSHPLIQWVPGALSAGGKAAGGEADHSLPFGSEVKNGGAIPPLPHTSLWHGVQLSTRTTLPYMYLISSLFKIKFVKDIYI
jgi:hypothetical protein